MVKSLVISQQRIYDELDASSSTRNMHEVRDWAGPCDSHVACRQSAEDPVLGTNPELGTD